MAEREPGPYWVRDRFEDEWVVALWSGFGWTLHGDEEQYGDADFIEIGPRAVMPPPAIPNPRDAIPNPRDRHQSTDTPPVTVMNFDLNTPEGKRALMAAFQLPQWPEPQPITDAQRTGERVLVWSECAREDPNRLGWLTARWAEGDWTIGGDWWEDEAMHLRDCVVTHYVPLPPPRQWSDEG